MSVRIIRRIAALVSLAACFGALRPARAAVPEPPEDAATSATSAANDTSRFLPRWLHVHAAAGLGWLASPEWLRKFYQAGQSYELGLETRPGSSFRLRLNSEYQVLPAVTDFTYTFITSEPGVDTEPKRDTVHVEARTNGWIGSARLEAQMALTPHIWLLGGFGRGYMSTGLQSVHVSDPFSSLDLDFPGSSGWAWIATAGTSYEFEIFGPRLSAEVRTSVLMRPRDRLQTWSIRLGWGGN